MKENTILNIAVKDNMLVIFLNDVVAYLYEQGCSKQAEDILRHGMEKGIILKPSKYKIILVQKICKQ